MTEKKNDAEWNLGEPIIIGSRIEHFPNAMLIKWYWSFVAEPSKAINKS